MTDVPGLPPATQEGKNTFGFLLNGQPWTPAGFNGTSNLSIYYDPTYQGGVFNIGAFRNIYSENGKRQSLVIFGDTIQVGVRIILPNKNRFGFDFWDEEFNCSYSSSDPSVVITAGYFEITKADHSKNIFSGVFEIKFRMNGCKDIDISKGRFDMKY